MAAAAHDGLTICPASVNIASQQAGETATGTFAPFLDGPLFKVRDPWLRSWLDALAFSLSGLPAADTSAAAMAYVLFDMHREGAALDYPKRGDLDDGYGIKHQSIDARAYGSKLHQHAWHAMKHMHECPPFLHN
eukprot:scaffold98082_cov37-Tisochrysis_lutea.AAC.2